MSIWQGEHYHGVRMVVNGELIDHYAYEFGDDSLEVAKQYGAEPFDSCLDARMQHWIKHHDRVLSNTAKVLERENTELRERVDKLEEQRDHLREVIETLWPRAAFTMSKACKETWIAELGELGVEVEDDEHSEY